MICDPGLKPDVEFLQEKHVLLVILDHLLPGCLVPHDAALPQTEIGVYFITESKSRSQVIKAIRVEPGH